tara:strand:- start:1815 stop:2108 length:294 start_codon:yes stop_codon:yes gene_type:complete
MSRAKINITAKMKMLEAGIVPAFTGQELVDMLDSLNYHDRRIAKRKFRKLWKKLAKENDVVFDMLTSGPGEEPTKAQKRNRACAVVRTMINSSNEDF